MSAVAATDGRQGLAGSSSALDQSDRCSMRTIMPTSLTAEGAKSTEIGSGAPSGDVRHPLAHRRVHPSAFACETDRGRNQYQDAVRTKGRIDVRPFVSVKFADG